MFEPTQITEPAHTPLGKEQFRARREELQFLESLRDQCLSSIGYRVWKVDKFCELIQAIQTYIEIQEKVAAYYK